MDIKNRYSYRELPESDAKTIEELIGDNGVMHMTVQTYSRGKQVCKNWHNAFHRSDPCKKLLPFQALFTPMFQRFVIFVNQIDTTEVPKFKRSSLVGYSDRFCYQIQTPMLQDIYESTMFHNALKCATQGYSSECEIWANDFLNSSDKDALLQAANIMSRRYYQSNLPKVLIWCHDWLIVPAAQSRFATLTIGALMQEVDKLEANTEVYASFLKLKELIIKYKLLPIKEGSVALAISSVPSSYELIIKGLILRILIMLMLFIFTQLVSSR